MSVKRVGSERLAPGAVSTDVVRRVRNPQGQGARLRAELIAAADRLLAETGDVEGLSLRAVARAVGIATPSIYLHFPNKQALFQAVLAARFAELGGMVRAAVQGEVGPAAQLRAGCLAYCRFAAEQPGAYRVLFGRAPARAAADSPTPQPPPHGDGEGERSVLSSQGQTAGGGGNSPAPLGAGTSAFGFLVDGVTACLRADAAPSRDPFIVATSVWTALHGIVTLRASLPAFLWPELERQVDDVLAGLVGLHHNPSPSAG